METRRWTNPSQPQTLQIAVWLLYFNAIWSLVFPGAAPFVMLGLGYLGVVLSIVGFAGGAFGIANDKRWGYFLAIGITVVELLPLALILIDDPMGALMSIGFLVNLLFVGARAALLLHPMSREYQRVWFR